jgi:multidrug efflux pump subunit AcrB
MPNKDGTANALDGLKHIGIALVFAVVIAMTGSSKHPWLILIVTPALTGFGAWLASKHYNKKFTDVQWIGGWAAVGLVIAIFWFFFGI